MDKQSDVSRPKFVVGEVVILQCQCFPDFNGERTVLRVLEFGDFYTCPVSGKFTRYGGEGIAYVLDDGGVDHELGLCWQWHESVLRKRHQPGEYSFDDLKTRLYLPVSRDELERLEREACHG